MKIPANHKQTILYIHYGDPWFRGSEHCLMTLLSNLDRDIYQPVLWTNNPVLAAQAQALDIDTQVQEFSLLGGWKAPRWNFSQWWRLYQTCLRLIDLYHVDLIHCNSAAPLQWATLAARRMDVPLLCHMHSQYPVRDKLTLGLYLSPLVVGVSQQTNASLLNDGYPKSCTKLVYNAIDYIALKEQPSRDIRRELGLSPDSILLASVGSLIERKRMDKLIKITAMLNAKGHDAHLMIIGSGPELVSLKQLAMSLQIKKKIHFMGEQPKVGSCLKGGVDIYVTAPDDEAFGLTILEAQAMKLPVVASRVGGIPEVIDDGETGILVEGELSDFCQSIEALIHAPEKRRTLAHNGARRAYSKFGTAHFYHEFHRLYQQQITEQGHYQNPEFLEKLATLAKGCIKSAYRILAKKFSFATQLRRV